MEYSSYSFSAFLKINLESQVRKRIQSGRHFHQIKMFRTSGRQSYRNPSGSKKKICKGKVSNSKMRKKTETVLFQENWPPPAATELPELFHLFIGSYKNWIATMREWRELLLSSVLCTWCQNPRQPVWVCVYR